MYKVIIMKPTSVLVVCAAISLPTLLVSCTHPRGRVVSGNIVFPVYRDDGELLATIKASRMETDAQNRGDGLVFIDGQIQLGPPSNIVWTISFDRCRMTNTDDADGARFEGR